MGKPNKNKNAQSEPAPTKAIEEPEFGVKLESKTLSAGDKKLLAQLERERKAQEEEERLRKEKLEADKKKKNNKASSSGKTKPKSGPPKNKEEEKKPVYYAPKPKPNENEANEARFQQETPKPKGTWNERVEKAERFQETTKSKIGNVGNEERLQKTPRQRITWDESDENAARFQQTTKSKIENVGNEERFQKTPRQRITWDESDENPAGFQETSKSKTTREENEADDSWYQDNNPTSNVTSTEPDAWDDWQGNDNNWRNETRRGISKPNYNSKYSQQNANNQNNFARRSNNQYTFNDGKNDKDFQIFYRDRSDVKGKVREEIGDLFNAPSEYSLAHCVAEDFSMGAGIAKEFRRRFKSVSKLLDQDARTGGLAILEDEDRFIYYLVTKAYSRGKPTLYTLWKSLLKLRDHITEHKVTKLAIPQIGCGLDRLDWFDVKRMLEYIFSKNEIDIVVYILELNAEETPTPSKSVRKCFVVNAVQPLTDIQTATGLIFFGTEDGAVSHEMECLAKKYDFINRYKNMRKSTGDAFKIVDRNEYLYGLIIRRTPNNKIVFADFERCLYNLKKLLKTDQTVYIGLQGFVEKHDEVITDKLVNLMQNTLQDVEIWVCWPEELKHLCPQQKQH